MSFQEECFLDCPYCGEPISVLVDCSLEQQTYVEDCQVC
ncbi:MAG TPA: CPXCG motif-containing cysteine-rich protein, partial [Cellvibrio sp.]